MKLNDTYDQKWHHILETENIKKQVVSLEIVYLENYAVFMVEEFCITKWLFSNRNLHNLLKSLGNPYLLL